MGDLFHLVSTQTTGGQRGGTNICFLSFLPEKVIFDMKRCTLRKAVANASTAWLYGASAVNCSLMGIGERTASRW